MSFKAVTWAFDQVTGLGATTKLVLLALAEFANDDNLTWRSREEIAKRAECGTRTVERSLKDLHDRNLISLSPRYAWCDSTRKQCAARPAHKHRSGTTYLLHLPETKHPRAEEIPTPAKMADVEQTAGTQANLHTRQNGGCGNKDASTPDTRVAPRPTHVSSIRSVNPQLNPQPDLTPVIPQLPKHPTGRVGSDQKEDLNHGHAADAASDRTLIAQCLPTHLRAMDTSGMRSVAAALEQRLAAGWTPKQIRQLMNQPLPEHTKRVSSLVRYRLEANVDQTGPPTSRNTATPLRAQAAPLPETPAEKAWTQHVWQPLYAKNLRSQPANQETATSHIAAGKQTRAQLAQLRLTPEKWADTFAETTKTSGLNPEHQQALDLIAEAAVHTVGADELLGATNA